MSEIEAVLVITLFVNNIVLGIVLYFYLKLKIQTKQKIQEYNCLINDYKKTLVVMDENITHLRKIVADTQNEAINVNCENIGSIGSTESTETIAVIENIDANTDSIKLVNKKDIENGK